MEELMLRERGGRPRQLRYRGRQALPKSTNARPTLVEDEGLGALYPSGPRDLGASAVSRPSPCSFR